jgi:hypothetical protein
MPSPPPHRVAHTIPDFCHHLSSSAPSPLGRPMTEIDQAGALGSRRSDQPRRRFIILLPLVTSLTATWLAQASSIIDGPKLDGLMQQHFLGRSVWLLLLVVVPSLVAPAGGMGWRVRLEAPRKGRGGGDASSPSLSTRLKDQRK